MFYATFFSGEVSSLESDVRVMCHFTVPEYKTHPGQELVLVSCCFMRTCVRAVDEIACLCSLRALACAA